MKNKYKNFINLYKSQQFTKGSTVELYSNKYTVLSSDYKYTLLRDNRGNPVAYPTKTLKTIILRQYKNKDEVTKSTAPSAAASTPKGDMKAGMIKVEKISPAGNKEVYWVHATKGTRHTEADENSQSHYNISKKDQKAYHEISSAIDSKFKGEQAKQAKEALKDYVKTKHEFKHLQDAHSQAVSQGGFFSSTHSIIENKLKEVNSKRKGLETMLKKKPE
jgi:hypothetical protein